MSSVNQGYPSPAPTTLDSPSFPATLRESPHPTPNRSPFTPTRLDIPQYTPTRLDTPQFTPTTINSPAWINTEVRMPFQATNPHSPSAGGGELPSLASTIRYAPSAIPTRMDVSESVHGPGKRSMDSGSLQSSSQVRPRTLSPSFREPLSYQSESVSPSVHPLAAPVEAFRRTGDRPRTEDEHKHDTK